MSRYSTWDFDTIAREEDMKRRWLRENSIEIYRACFLLNVNFQRSLHSRKKKISIIIYDVSSCKLKRRRRRRRRREKKRNFRYQCVTIICSRYKSHSQRELYWMDSSLSPLHGFDDNRLYPPLNTQDVSFKNINVGILPFTRKKKTKKSVLAILSRVQTAPHRISSLFSFLN